MAEDRSRGQSSSVFSMAIIGCGTALIVALACGGGLAWIGFQGWEVAEENLMEIADSEELAADWTPPDSTADPAAFSPPMVAGYTLQASDTEAAFPALGIRSEGGHAAYMRDGKTVDVAIYSMTEAEKEAAFKEVIRRIDDDERFSSHSYVALPRTLTFSVKEPELHGRFWWAAGVLVFVRSGEIDSEGLKEFQQKYLAAIDQSGAEAEEASNPESAPTADVLQDTLEGPRNATDSN